MSQHHIEDNVNSFNTQISFNNVSNNYTVADEMSQILAWLSPLEPQIRHRDIQTRRVGEVGNWLLQTEEYRNWFGGICAVKSGGSALFCYGGPGVGKTYISSLVIDTLCKKDMERNASIACLYFDFAAPEEQSAAAVLGLVLKQIVRSSNEVLERIVKAFRDRDRFIGGQWLELAEIVQFLQDMSSSRSTFICIDALDECPLAYRVNLLDSLYQILQNSPGARVFLTGRPHILDEVDRHLSGRVTKRSITPNRKDIIVFLRAKLKEDTIPDAMDKSLEKEIMENIPETASEVFLLVVLSIKTILQEATIYRRRQRLSAMRNGIDLGGAYVATLGRIKAQDREKARLGMAVLMWISHSRRPLQVDEICHAVAIQIGSNYLDNEDIPTILTLLDCCQGLVTVGRGSSTVRLIHFTLQEHLCKNPDLFDRAHLTMAETCLTYLNFQRIKDLSAGPPPDSCYTPFLEYSSLYWGTHMRIERSDRAKIFALELLGQFGSHISAKSQWRAINGGLSFDYYSDDKPFSALHCISYFGIPEVTNILIKMKKWDVNQSDGLGMTPLMLAAKYGHEEVVRLLLQEKHIQPDQQDENNGRTALSWAAGNGHEGVVRLFLGRQFVNPGNVGRRWEKAAQAVGLRFGGRYINSDSSDRSGGRLLSCAANNGHEGVVKVLLRRKEVNPESLSKSGRTPLSWAAGNGHEGIVKLLLGRKDVNPDTPDTKYDLTPLSFAAMNGHKGMVELLLGRKDVNPNTPDTRHGLTPLSWAAVKSQEGIVKLLLGRKDVNPDTPDMEHGLTPLSVAATNGHEGIAKLLLGRKDVNPDSSSNFGRTPLSLAAGSGHEGIVKLLLGRKDINSVTLDTEYGLTPLSWAAQNGHEGIVKLLLGREDVSPDSPSNSGQTPLSLAAGNGHEGIVKLLLKRKDVSPDTPDTKDSLTPLSWAARNGREGIVNLLLKREDVNPDSSSKSGRTPLSWAAKNGHEGVVKLLLQRQDVDPNRSSKSGQTPLTLAAKNRHNRIVELLQARLPDAPSN